MVVLAVVAGEVMGLTPQPQAPVDRTVGRMVLRMAAPEQEERIQAEVVADVPVEVG